MAQKVSKPCPICKLNEQAVEVWDYGERFTLKCSRCGAFTITGSAAAVAEQKALTPKLSAWIRDRHEAAVEPPEITTNTLRDIERMLPSYRVGEKQLLLLRALERKTKTPGKAVYIVREYDYPLSWAADEEEFDYLLTALMRRGLIRQANGSGELTGLIYHLLITPEGWEHLESHARPSVISDQVFIAMSFSTELKAAWDNGLRPALARAGFKPYRVDAEPHLERIDSKIITEIRNSRFLVADVTLQRPGVYFEAGFAIGLGLPVFWSVRKDDLANVHFDTRQYNHVVWETEQELEDQMYYFVTSVVGKGSAT